MTQWARSFVWVGGALFVIALVGCYYGLNASGGTQGVGRATTQAMVVASVLIFVLTFFITRIFTSQLVSAS